MPEFRKLAEDVYAFLQPPLVWYSSSGVIVGDKDVIVVDSLTNAVMTRALRDCIRKITGKPIAFLINTHEHADHVYTNHMFPEATSIASHRGREQTRTNAEMQSQHHELFRKFFPEVDLEGGRYTPQDMGFSGSLILYQGRREVRVLELGVGHSASDVVIYLPSEKIVFCGDVFVNGMPPMPGEGHVTETIANYKAIEALGADIYVAGHGQPGALAEVRGQRQQLELLFQHASECFAKGMDYDTARQDFASDEVAMDFQRLALLASYWEFMGRRPSTTEPESQNHMALLRCIADEAERLFAPGHAML